jgi:hypothetical protein
MDAPDQEEPSTFRAITRSAELITTPARGGVSRLRPGLVEDTIMRDVYPVKYYKDEGFVEYKIEIDEEDLQGIIEEYLHRHGAFDFDDMTLVNNRPINIWLYVKCRKYVDPDNPGDDLDDAEVEIAGAYDDNPTGV